MEEEREKQVHSSNVQMILVEFFKMSMCIHDEKFQTQWKDVDMKKL